MFDFLAESLNDRARICGPGRSRREFLQIGALSALGLSLPQYVRAAAEGTRNAAVSTQPCLA